MDVSPKTLREVEFREKMRGYHPEDVDQFLEQAAAALETMQDRLRQAVERAQRAEAAAAAAPPPSPDTSAHDDTLKRTLVLAQRTADMAVAEAREQAARILAGAEQKAQGVIAEAEERARRAHEESLGGIRSELGSLEALRQRAQSEVDLLSRWIDDHRTHIASSLREALSVVERSGALSAPPASTPIEGARRPAPTPDPVAAPSPTTHPPGSSPPVDPPARQTAASPGAPPAASGPPPSPPPARPVAPQPAVAGAGASGPRPSGGRPVVSAPSAGRAAAVAPAPRPPSDDGPETVVWHPGADTGGQINLTGGGDEPTGEHGAIEAHEQALDDFFDDGEATDDRRFGGRLRRRR